MKDMQQGQDMLLVTVLLGLPNIIDNHVTHLLATVLLRQKILSKRCCNDFGEVFVLCNGEHLLLGQATQSNAIFKRDHFIEEPKRVSGRSEVQVGIMTEPVSGHFNCAPKPSQSLGRCDTLCQRETLAYARVQNASQQPFQ